MAKIPKQRRQTWSKSGRLPGRYQPHKRYWGSYTNISRPAPSVAMASRYIPYIDSEREWGDKFHKLAQTYPYYNKGIFWRYNYTPTTRTDYYSRTAQKQVPRYSPTPWIPSSRYRLDYYWRPHMRNQEIYSQKPQYEIYGAPKYQGSYKQAYGPASYTHTQGREELVSQAAQQAYRYIQNFKRSYDYAMLPEGKFNYPEYRLGIKAKLWIARHLPWQALTRDYKPVNIDTVYKPPKPCMHWDETLQRKVPCTQTLQKKRSKLQTSTPFLSQHQHRYQRTSRKYHRINSTYHSFRQSRPHNSRRIRYSRSMRKSFNYQESRPYFRNRRRWRS